MNTDTPLTSKELRAQAKSLLEEAETTERIESVYASAKEAAIGLGNMRDCLVNEGFTQDEAFELIRLLVQGGIK